VWEDEGEKFAALGFGDLGLWLQAPVMVIDFKDGDAIKKFFSAQERRFGYDFYGAFQIERTHGERHVPFDGADALEIIVPDGYFNVHRCIPCLLRCRAPWRGKRFDETFLKHALS